MSSAAGRIGDITLRAAPRASVALAGAVDCGAYVFQRGYRIAAGRALAPAFDAPVDLYLDWLDRCGFTHGVLLQPSFYGRDNTCLIDALARAPYRLRGVASLAPETPEHELWSLDALGVRGVRLSSTELIGTRFDAEPWPRFLRLLAGMGWHVEVSGRIAALEPVAAQVLRHGVDVILCPVDAPGRVSSLADPGFRALQRLGRTRRAWARLCAAPAGGLLAGHATLREALGPERLIWGGDWPHARVEAEGGPAGAFVERLFPDAAERAAIFVRNPAGLFRFD